MVVFFALVAVPAAFAQSSVVAAYGLNEGSGTTTADLSGNNNNGTLQGGPTWTTAGKYGNALSFGGTNGFVTVPASSTLNLGASGTIEAWVKPNAINRWNSVMAKGNVNSDPPTNYGLEINNSNQFLCILGNGSSAETLASTTAVTAGTFYHVACVWNGTQLQLYVNGT
ncbi:MAG TPA: LamG domain-containing protein, partial [Terriglobales bacterium]